MLASFLVGSLHAHFGDIKCSRVHPWKKETPVLFNLGDGSSLLSSASPSPQAAPHDSHIFIHASA